jgi:hypothetical protein
VYLFGGSAGTSSSILNVVGTFNELSSEIPARPGKLLIEVGNSTNTFELLPNVKLGVNNIYYDTSDGSRHKIRAALYQNDTWTEI